jgi:hypothetical protein
MRPGVPPVRARFQEGGGLLVRENPVDPDFRALLRFRAMNLPDSLLLVVRVVVAD